MLGTYRCIAPQSTGDALTWGSTRRVQDWQNSWISRKIKILYWWKNSQSMRHAWHLEKRD